MRLSLYLTIVRGVEAFRAAGDNRTGDILRVEEEKVSLIGEGAMGVRITVAESVSSSSS